MADIVTYTNVQYANNQQVNKYALANNSSEHMSSKQGLTYTVTGTRLHIQGG